MCQFFAQGIGQKFYMPIGMVLATLQELCQPQRGRRHFGRLPQIFALYAKTVPTFAYRQTSLSGQKIYIYLGMLLATLQELCQKWLA
jgi:hypothetical protein